MEPIEWTIGIHKMNFEPPDICHCHINGRVAAEEAKLALELIDKEIVPKVGDNFYFVAHLSSDIKKLSAEPRKYASSIKPKWKASVVIGRHVLLRTVVNMIFRTANLMSGTSVPLRMVGTVEEAYALINEWRAGRKPG
jgi:hypothetical protein